ncbi:MAG: hypothetical protein ACKVJU_11830 [Verrucomicrobiales bacterium]
MIWQERAGGKVQKIDIDVMRATEGHLFQSESDAGLRYGLEFETEHEPILTFDVPGRKADTVLKVRLRPDW